MGKGGGSAPDPPTAGEDYASYIQAYSKYAPEREATALSDLRNQIEMARVYADEGLEPSRALLQGQLGIAGELAPQIRALGDDPQTAAIRSTLGSQIEADLAAGAGMTPEMQRQIEQQIRAGQSARGMTRGAAPVNAEALLVGMQGEQLKRQRQQMAQQFIQLQAATQPDPFQTLTGSASRPGGGGFGGMGAQAPSYQQFANTSQQNAQIAYNAAQANRGGGMSGAISGGLGGAATGFAIGGPPGAAVGGLIGGIGGLL